MIRAQDWRAHRDFGAPPTAPERRWQLALNLDGVAA